MAPQLIEGIRHSPALGDPGEKVSVMVEKKVDRPRLSRRRSERVGDRILELLVLLDKELPEGFHGTVEIRAEFHAGHLTRHVRTSIFDYIDPG